ncbi:MAG TPA: hypothetical protein VJ851_04035 [Jatrophihabitans sp.]|nr:hypothetical protein [Jatrophihabitans sp.]
MTFTDLNHQFVLDQARGRPADYLMAAAGADRYLAGLGITHHTLPYICRVDAPTYRELVNATDELVTAQQKVMQAVCTSLPADELVRLFGVPPGLAAVVDWAELAASRFRLLRADIIPTESGYYFCEINHFSAVGGGEAYHSAKVFAELLGRPVSGVSPFRELAYHYIEECRRSGLERVVVLDSAEHRKLGFGEHRLLQEYLKLMAPDLEVGYWDDENYPREWLAEDEASRTLVHRLITLDETPDGGAFLSLLRERGCTVSCMFEAELKMHRKWFSLLCDPVYHHLLNPTEVAVIQRYVPHTFELDHGNLRSTLADKNDYVFKTSYSYGGKGILMGAEHSREDLEQRLRLPGIEAWTCQRVVPTASLELPPSATGERARHHVVLGMFGYGENYNGLFVRGAGGSQVVNVSQGGGVSWAFVD